MDDDEENLEILISNKEVYEKIQNEKHKEYFNNELKKLKPCPDCGTDDFVSNIYYGMYSGEWTVIAETTKIGFFMGCLVPKNIPTHRCRKCQKPYK
jgi:hypothetical protein